jgi:hypothetical protein
VLAQVAQAVAAVVQWTVPASVDTVSSCPIRREFVDGFDTP